MNSPTPNWDPFGFGFNNRSHIFSNSRDRRWGPRTMASTAQKLWARSAEAKGASLRKPVKDRAPYFSTLAPPQKNKIR